jgi:hypothetical protein
MNLRSIILMFGLLAGCGGAPSTQQEVPAPQLGDPSERPSSTSVRQPALESLSIDIGVGRKNAVFADPSTSDEVRAILMDGTITFSEYESSVLAMAACVRENGGVFFRPDQPRLSWRGLYTYSTGFPEAVPGAQASVAGCVDRHVGILDLFWKELTNPTREEEAGAMEALAACMGSVGLGDRIPQGRRREDFEQLGPALNDDDRGLYMGCAQRIGDEYALPYFGPTY